MRPTGRLHIGHYFGALQNWVRLQNDPAYECFYFVADWHALTSDYANTSSIAENTLQIAIDFLASGLDPAKSVIFQQSQIIEHAELHLLLSMVTPLGWLERIPTYKEQIENVTNKDLHTYGFLGYPTLQTADIVMYSDPAQAGSPAEAAPSTAGAGKPLFVPVGEDQVSHVEFSRELVRTFNLHNLTLDTEALSRSENADAYRVIRGSFDPKMLSFLQHQAPTLEEIYELQTLVRKRVGEVGLENFLDHLNSLKDFKDRHIAFRRFLKEPLVEPDVLLTQTPRIPGLDGRKMSKSYNNAITLSESDADIRSKTRVMVTDPARKRRADPGNPDVCPVYDWHKLFSTPDRDPGRLDWVQTGCRSASIGCIECKSAMADNLIQWIEPVRARRLDYQQHPKRVLEILDAGSATARKSAQQTMSRVREAVLGWSRKRRALQG
jgi:tryptophanyl-tRNA synthetase